MPVPFRGLGMPKPYKRIEREKMDFKHAVKKQYQASLTMLGQAIENCPDSLWIDQSYANKFWHIAFHTLYFTDFYTQKSEKEFVKWEKHKDGFEFLDRLPEQEPIPIEDVYTKKEVLEYYNYIVDDLHARIDSTDMEADSGVSWIPFQKFELQIHNIKHIQHHVGMMFERLRNNDIDVEWARREG